MIRKTFSGVGSVRRDSERLCHRQRHHLRRHRSVRELHAQQFWNVDQRARRRSVLANSIGLQRFPGFGRRALREVQPRTGLTAPTGGQADATRFFDRQSWLGIATTFGEFRAGRQNTAIFYRGNCIDFTRMLGPIAMAAGVPTDQRACRSTSPSPTTGTAEASMAFSWGSCIDSDSHTPPQISTLKTKGFE
jgi:hypothetical protein